MTMLLAALVASAPLELDVGVAASTNFSPETFFAQRLGPRVSVGVSGLEAGPVQLGTRVGLQYDVTLHRAFELQAQAFAHRRFGLFEPSLGLGVNVFLEEGRGALVFANLGLALRPGKLIDVFVEFSPGLIADRFGTAPWLMVALGLRLHVELPQVTVGGDDRLRRTPP